MQRRETRDALYKLGVGVLYFFACLGIVGGSIAAWVAMHYYLALDLDNTLLSPPFEDEKATGVNANPRIYIAGCTNDTGTRFEFKIENLEGYAISYLCPVSKNQCESHICTANRTCQQVLAPGATCSEDSECYDTLGAGYRCNPANCSCVQQDICYSDGDCPVSENTCAPFTCNTTTGTCVQTLAVNATCYSSDQCMDDNQNEFFYCNQSSCQCVYENPLAMNISCAFDSNCQIPLSPCSYYACIDGVCVETLLPNATCAYSESCGETNLTCSWTSCQCENIPPLSDVICGADSDCPSLLNPCSKYYCISGSCVEDLVTNATCSENSQCEQNNGTAFYCNLNQCACNGRSPLISAVSFPIINFTTVDLTVNISLVSFQDESVQKGPIFYSHAAGPWDVLTFPDSTNASGDVYMTWFYVYTFTDDFMSGDCAVYLTSAYFGDNSTSIPGCIATMKTFGEPAISDVYGTIISGECMFPGYPYGPAGISMVVTGPFIAGIENPVRIAPNYGLEPDLVGAWVIQKMS